MILTKERKGEFFTILGAFLWGLFPVITYLSLTKIPALISLGISTILAAVFFGIVLSIKKKWHEVKNISALKDILLVTFFIGIIYYLLYFFGLRYTSPGNASIIALTEVFFSFLFFQVWRKEYIPYTHIVGAFFMVIGAIIVLYPGFRSFQRGDLLVMAAAFVAPFGNFFQQKARKKVSSETIMFIRSMLSGIFILFLTFILKTNVSYHDLKTAIIFLAINGVVILGLSKALWIEGIYRISVTKAVALETVSPLVTLLFVWMLLKTSPTIWQLFSFIPMFLGIVFLGKNQKQK